MPFLGAGKHRERGFFVMFHDDKDEDPRPRFVDAPAGGRAVLFDRDEGIGMIQMISETLGLYVTIQEPETEEVLWEG